MKIYHLDINSIISKKKYWLYYIDCGNVLFNTIYESDSYHEIRIIMDLYGLKIRSIRILRKEPFPNYAKKRPIDSVLVYLKK